MRNKYLSLFKKISLLEKPVYVFGGFAEDALLFGKTMRDHEDIDIMVSRKDTDTYAKLFQGFGFKDYEIYLHDPLGKPTVLHSENKGLAIEFCIYDVDDHGKKYFYFYGESDNDTWHIYIPDDTFEYPKSTLDGVSIQTVSPLAQYQIRAGLGITNSFGGYREKDIVSQEKLKEKFFPQKTEAELKPKVVHLP